jgi:3-oxosteroid 1-dehydrogenase
VEVDVVVVGSGAGALAGAFTAVAQGLRTVVLEKSDVCGGITAYSGGSVFLPGNPLAVAAGLPCSADRARTYLHALLGDEDKERQEAFLETAPGLLDHLTRDPALRFVLEPMSEYYDAPGRLPGGSQVAPEMLTAEELGEELLALVRPAIGPDRWGTEYPREQLWGGQALVGRFLLALQRSGLAEVRTGTAVDRLVVEGDRVVGVEAQTAQGRVTVRARRGVLLACGGFERNAALRERFGVPGRAEHSMAPRETNTGEALEAGLAVGAAVDHLQEAWFCPGLLEPDGSAGFYIGLRGGIAVGPSGERFANESLPYDRFGREMAKHAPEAWLVFDAREKGRVPGIRCVTGPRREDYVAAGAWVGADDLATLAERMGVPADALTRTVERFNGFAEAGVDADFHRGEDEFDLRWAFPSEQQNPCLFPIDQGPYVAARIVLGDLGTKGGLATDADANVLREDGSVIPGLYAAGNTMAAVTGPVYPAPGTPIGTAMVFAHRAVLKMAQAPST